MLQFVVFPPLTEVQISGLSPYRSSSFSEDIFACHYCDIAYLINNVIHCYLKLSGFSLAGCNKLSVNSCWRKLSVLYISNEIGMITPNSPSIVITTLHRFALQGAMQISLMREGRRILASRSAWIPPTRYFLFHRSHCSSVSFTLTFLLLQFQFQFQ